MIVLLIFYKQDAPPELETILLNRYCYKQGAPPEQNTNFNIPPL